MNELVMRVIHQFLYNEPAVPIVSYSIEKIEGEEEGWLATTVSRSSHILLIFSSEPTQNINKIFYFCNHVIIVIL